MAFLKNSEIKLLQRHLKSINSAIRRGYSKNTDQVSDMINDMLYEYSTPKGYFFTGAKRLKDMSKSEIERLMSTADTVHDLLTTKDLIFSLNKDEYDPKDLWYAVDYAAKQGTIPPSGMVKSIVDSLTENPNNDLFHDAFGKIVEVGSGNMGVADFYETFEALL